MKRKLVEQGTCTLMVSLPRAWGKRHNLKKGDEVVVTDNGSGILIKPDVAQKKETEYTFTKHGETQVRFAIISAYRAGFNVIRVNYTTQEQFEWMKKIATDNSIGLEITPTSKNSCIIESITEPSHDHFDLMFTKLLQNSSLFIRSTLARVQGTSDFNEYELIMSNVHKYDNFCRRVLTQQSPENINFYWSFLSSIVHCVRELYHTNRYLEKYNVTFSTDLTPYFHKLLDVVIDALHKKDIGKLEVIDTMRLEWYQVIITEYRNKENDGMVMLHLCAAIRNLYLATSPLSGIIVEKNQGSKTAPV